MSEGIYCAGISQLGEMVVLVSKIIGYSTLMIIFINLLILYYVFKIYKKVREE